jgi:hypothetical protein
LVVHSSFIVGSHSTKNMASGLFVSYSVKNPIARN